MIPIQKNLNNKAQIQNKKHQGRDNYQSKKKKLRQTYLLKISHTSYKFVNIVSIFFLVGSDGKYFQLCESVLSQLFNFTIFV